MPTTDQPDAGLWLSSAVLALPLHPVARFVLAFICQRAAGQNGQCPQPSDEELADRLMIHAPGIPEVIKLLQLTKHVAVVSKSTPQLLRPSVELLADYLPRVCFNSTAPSLPGMVSADPAVRVCPVTGVDVSRQRENVPLANRTTLSKLAGAYRPTFDQLVTRFMPALDRSLSIDDQARCLANHIRQRWSAHRSGLL